MAAFSRYNLLRRIGVGGMAEVWKAKAIGPEGFEKTVAIKKVLPEFADSRDFIAMFVEEAKLVADLVHPNIVQVFDFGRAGPGEYFIAMEYVGGQNLGAILIRTAQRGIKLPLEVGLYIATECARGLAYAHSKRDAAGNPLKIVHRDMSPANILVSFGGEVKITDFGIAKAKTTVERTEVGIVRGNAAYLSPEQARMEPLDQRSDLFTLGVVMFELFTGARLFKGNNLQDLVAQAAQFRFPATEVASLPIAIQQVLQSTLRTDPHRRFGEAAELEEALDEVIGSRNEARRALIALMASLFEEERIAEGGVDVGDPVAERSISLSRSRTGEVAEPRPSSAALRRAGPGTAVMPSASFSGASATSGASSDGPSTAAIPGQAFDQPTAIVESDRDGGPFTMAIPASPVVVEESTPHSGAVPVAIPDASKSGPTAPRERQRTRGMGAFAALAVLALAVGAGAWVSTQFDWGGAPTPIAATSAPKAAPSAAETAATTPTPEPAPTRVAIAAPKKGRLVVNAAPWCRVLLDGRKIADETPVEVPISAGKHVIRFENPVLKLAESRTVDVKPGEKLEFFVDATKKKITLSRR